MKNVLSVQTVLRFYFEAASRYKRDFLGTFLSLPFVIVIGDILPSLTSRVSSTGWPRTTSSPTMPGRVSTPA